MSPSWLLSLAVFLVFFSLASAKGGGSSKYSKEKNSLKEDLDTQLRQSEDGRGGSSTTRKPSGHFRVARLEAVWQRAQKQLNVDDQRDVFDLLQDLDEDEITLKRVRHDGGDKDGEITAKLSDKLYDILERYGLLTPSHDKSRGDSSKQQTTGEPKRTAKQNQATLELLFADKKLNKLWGKAKKAGFTEGELNALKSEFVDHQLKIDGYRGAADANVNQEPVDSNRFHDLADELSHEERLDEKARKLTHNPDEIVKLDAGVKSIIKNYGQLKAKVNKNILAPETGDFKEARVEELWKQALQAGFDRDELLSLRGELAHFERKLEKLKNFRDGTITGKNEADTRMKAGERSEDHLDLEQKVKHYTSKVDSIHQDIERRINNRHNEL